MQHAYAKYTNNQDAAVKELSKALQKHKKLAALVFVCHVTTLVLASLSRLMSCATLRAASPVRGATVSRSRICSCYLSNRSAATTSTSAVWFQHMP